MADIMATMNAWDIFVLVILAGSTILMMSGKGGFLLKNGKSSSKQFLDEYDEKKTTRVLSVILLLLTILEVLNIFFSENIPNFLIIYPVGLAVILVVGTIVVIKTCKK